MDFGAGSSDGGTGWAGHTAGAGLCPVADDRSAGRLIRRTQRVAVLLRLTFQGET